MAADRPHKTTEIMGDSTTDKPPEIAGALAAKHGTPEDVFDHFGEGADLIGRYMHGDFWLGILGGCCGTGDRRLRPVRLVHANEN